MNYYSQKENLIIPEYGRNLQNLVTHALSIEDKEKQQNFCNGLIKLMHQISPQTKTAEESNDRLWNHLMRISDYKLDVEMPDDVIILKHVENITKAKRIPYTKSNKFRHYGLNISKLIDKATLLEEGDKKQEFIEYIAAFMKLVYKTYNQDHYINDNTIKSDLLNMSDNKLVFDDETMNIDLLVSHIKFSSKTNTKSSNKKNKKNNHKNRKRR